MPSMRTDLRYTGMVMLNPRKGQLPCQFTQVNGYPETLRPAHLLRIFNWMSFATGEVSIGVIGADYR